MHFFLPLRYVVLNVEIEDYNLMIDGKIFLINQLNTIEEHMIVIKKLQQVREMIAQQVVC